MSSIHLFRGARRLAHRLRADGGNVAMIFALSMPMAMGGAGLVAETSYDYFQKNRLQAAADAAAYAAALENRAGSGAAAINGAAISQATSNGWTASTGTITVNTPPTSGANQVPNAVEVRLTKNAPRFFSAIFDSQPMIIAARSVAIAQNAGDACILALDKTSSGAVQVQGNSTLNLKGCDVMSNSVANDGVNVWGSAKLTANCVESAGGITNKSGLTLTGCLAGITQAPRVADPFAALPTPGQGPNRNMPNNNGNKGPTTLQPGSYKNGMDLSGNVVLSPGTYYVSGGNFSVNANAVVSGSGVTIFLEAGAQVSMNGNASVSLSAPTSGTYSGILFFGDRTATSGSNTFNGDATSSLTGDIYFPTQQVSYLGNFSGVNGCTQIVANQVQWNGNASVGVDCAAAGMSKIPARQAITLVE